MRKKWIIQIFILFLVLNFVVALYVPVSTLIWTNQAEFLFHHPRFQPQFVSSVSPAPGSTTRVDNHLTPSNDDPAGPCIDVYEGANELWETGDSEKGITFWKSHMKLIVDGRLYKLDEKQSIRSMDHALFVWDEQGKILRAATDYSICFDIVRPEGLHMATLALTTTSGKILSYSWSFRTQ